MPYRKVGALEACWYMIRYRPKEARRAPDGEEMATNMNGMNPEDTQDFFVY